MKSDPKTAAESARTKEEHKAAAAYHKEREQIAQSEGRPNAATLHFHALLLHREAARCGTDAPVKWHTGGSRAVGDLAREWSEWARRCDEDERYNTVSRLFVL
jgi:hypothetical protein